MTCEVAVEVTAVQEFGVGAGGGDAAGVEDDDLVGIGHGGQPVGHDQHGSPDGSRADGLGLRAQAVPAAPLGQRDAGAVRRVDTEIRFRAADTRALGRPSRVASMISARWLSSKPSSS